MKKKMFAFILIATLVLLTNASVFAQSYWNNDIRFTASHGTVTVDGKIDAGEWDDTQAITMKLNNDPMAERGYVNYQGEWENDRSDSDYQGTYKIKWDENYIYFLEERTDDHINLEGDAEGPWTTDGALIFTQAPDSDASVNPDGISHHIFYTVGLYGKIGGNVMVRVCNLEYQTRDVYSIKDAKIASALTDNGYIVEIAVPWSMYKSDIPAFTTPNAGDIMGLSYVVHDSDTDEEGFVKQFCYAIDNDMTSEVYGGYDFGGWGTLELLAPVAVVEETTEAPTEAPTEAVTVEETVAPVEAPVETTTVPASVEVPQTGDMNISLIIFVALALVSVVIGISTIKAKKVK